MIGVILYAEKEGFVKKEEQPEKKEIVRSVQTEIPDELKYFKASDSRDDSDILKELFYEVTDYTPPNKELQVYMAGQTRIEDNKAVMTAEYFEDHLYSGKLESKIAFRYGTFAFKVHTMRGKGLFPAIWMMPSEGELFPELDLYELIGNEPDLFYGVLHYYNNDMKKRNFFQHRFQEGNIPDEYEVKLEWTPDKLIWYLNGEEVHRMTEYVPQVPMYMSMNLAVGGIWPGDPDEDTIFPASFETEILEFHVEEVYVR